MRTKFILLLFIVTMLSGCAMNNSKKTLTLHPGMTVQEAQQALGTDPEGSQFIQGYQILKFSLHRAWVGWVPHYLAFDGQTGKLVAWKENMNEYFATQQLWVASLPKQVNVNGNVDVNTNANIRGTFTHDVTIKK